jgi:hypothetical protein
MPHSTEEHTFVRRLKAQMPSSFPYLKPIQAPETIAKPKKLVISGPMDAQHVDGVNVMNSSGPGLEAYFNSTVIAPDERPSHTYVASGKTEVPRRSDTIRRPSISLKRSLSRLRRTSTSHHPASHRNWEDDRQAEITTSGSESVDIHRPLKMQSSMSQLRQKLGRESPNAVPSSTTSPEPASIPEPIREGYPPLQSRTPLARLTTVSSVYTTYSDPETPQMSIMPQQSSAITRRYSAVRRRPSPLQDLSSVPKTQLSQPPARPKRKDSGTAIDFTNVPVQERPIPFKEIMAVASLPERMVMYKKTREYWASADHGLVEWTERTVTPKTAARGS